MCKNKCNKDACHLNLELSYCKNCYCQDMKQIMEGNFLDMTECI